MKNVQRGMGPKDHIEFGDDSIIKLKKAAEELIYLLNRGYHVKAASTFIGNHYMLSERQRIALSRMISDINQLNNRKNKELLTPSDTVYIDGFNTIITLEVALSHSLLIKGFDGTIRDLAGLRGTYRVIDKTEPAIRMILNKLVELHVKEAVFYLDKPVSNSGRLGALILEVAKDYKINVQIHVIYDVDSQLETLDNVITSDAIILDQCLSWFNLLQLLISEFQEPVWLLDLTHER